MQKGSKMTKGEKMRQQVLNALVNCRYAEDLYHLTSSDKHYNKIIDGIIVVIKGLPAVDGKEKVA